MEIPQSSLGVSLNILTASFFALLSYLFDTPVRGSRLTIGRLAFSAAHDIHYEAIVGNKTYTFAFNASSLTWRFHLPRAPNPRWATITCNSIYYTSTTGEISTARIEVILWFFPVLFRQTSGPWVNVTLDDLRIKVYHSSATPYFVQRLRENLVGTMLTGEVLRADVFRTSMRMSGLTERPRDKPTGFTQPGDKLYAGEPAAERHGDRGEDEPNEVEEGDDTDNTDYTEDTDDTDDGCESDSDAVEEDEGAPYGHTNELSFESEDPTKPLRRHNDDELCFSVLARQLHIHNTEGRIYTFGSIDSQIRRDWTQNRGSLAMVAEECRWVHVHFPFERVAPRSWWTQLFSSFFHFPSDLVHTFKHPVNNANLYVSRLDVTFDSFRLRDAELLKQGFYLIREKSITARVDWSDVFFDAITHAIAPN
ncbi:hypothetical protein C8Q76DRAFT_859880 [Earliella scabrosa]|nr:hypothetical protein C8Q76DRAFT_859880 [Earliella scabrosa]